MMRIKNDQVPFRHEFLMRLRHGLRLQPIKHIDRFERTLLRQPICLCIPLGHFQSLSALIQAMDVSCTGPRRVEAKAAVNEKQSSTCPPFPISETIL